MKYVYKMKYILALLIASTAFADRACPIYTYGREIGEFDDPTVKMRARCPDGTVVSETNCFVKNKDGDDYQKILIPNGVVCQFSLMAQYKEDETQVDPGAPDVEDDSPDIFLRYGSPRLQIRCCEG